MFFPWCPPFLFVNESSSFGSRRFRVVSRSFVVRGVSMRLGTDPHVLVGGSFALRSRAFSAEKEQRQVVSGSSSFGAGSFSASIGSFPFRRARSPTSSEPRTDQNVSIQVAPGSFMDENDQVVEIDVSRDGSTDPALACDSIFIPVGASRGPATPTWIDVRASSSTPNDRLVLPPHPRNTQPPDFL
jgi:hypothetical protein